jgi:hypothetical protein
MSSEDRQLRDALEKAQAALKATRAELDRAKDDQTKLKRTAEELEVTRRELVLAEERERSLAEALEASRREHKPPVEFAVPPPELRTPVAAPLVIASPPVPQTRSGPPPGMSTGVAGVLLIAGGIMALAIPPLFCPGVIMICIGLPIAFVVLNNAHRNDKG